MLFSTPALMAQENAPGWSAFLTSNFRGALTEATEAGTADGYALACRAATVLGGYFSTGDEAVAYLHKAIENCEKALEQDPDHLIGKMTYAMTVGFEGKRINSPSYASRSRKIFEELVSTYPENPLARAGLAGWHSEVHAAGFFIRTALGGSRKKAKTGFEEALALGTLDLPLRLEYAKFLARGKKSDREAAFKLLTAIEQATPANGFERILIGVATKIKVAVASGKKSRITKAIKETGAFFGIEDWDDAQKYELSAVS